MVFDINVFKALNPNAIKDFIESKNIDIYRKTSEYNLDVKEKRYWFDLLDNLHNHGFVKTKEVEEFLCDELKYGRAGNVYIEFIKQNVIIEKSEIIKRINLLEVKGYKGSNKVTQEYYKGNIREFIDLGEKRLIESYLEVEDEKVTNISLLFGEGISIDISGRSNNYYCVDINLKLNILTLRMINWAGKVIPENLPDNRYEKILDDIKSVFSIVASANQKEGQNLVYNLVDDLTYKVLSKTINYVNQKIKKDIVSKVNFWGNTVLPGEKSIGKRDSEVITEIILNNYYRIKLSDEHKTLTQKVMREVYNVQAYARQVKFFDETAGEGRARSSDTDESVLDTSVFFDIKARLDKEKNIKNAIIYWMACNNNKTFGTAIHLENLNRFKIVFYPLRINKEMYEYVLQQIKSYSK